MRIATYIMKHLDQNEVKYIFGIPAGTTGSIYDAVNDTNIKSIVTKNEAGAVYSATKYASITGKLGVCILAGGVGINNAINGIADAYRQKTPVLIISGSVHRWQMGKGAIQELNTENIVKPITKYSKTIMKREEVFEELNKAINIALTPPYGPVHLSIPIDLQISDFDGEIAELKLNNICEDEYDREALNKAINLLNKEEKGIIMVGRGCRGISEDIKELSQKLRWPIITTPEGKGIISSEFEFNLGNYGFSNTDIATKYVEESDTKCILVLGTSLGESATRNYNDVLVKNRKVIHIDWDKKELNKVFEADVPVYYDLKLAIPQLIKNINTKKLDLSFSENKVYNTSYEKNHTGLSIRLFLENIVDILPSNTLFACDIGEFMNLVFKYLPIKEGMDFDISLNYGAMGVTVGGAMGINLAAPEKQVAVIVGDGSFYMNGIEILTAKEYKMPIIYFVINNAMLGYVEHGNSFLYKRSLEGIKQERISIADMSKAMGIKSMQIKNIDELSNIKEFITDLEGPCIIELITDGSEKIPAADRFKALANK